MNFSNKSVELDYYDPVRDLIVTKMSFNGIKVSNLEKIINSKLFTERFMD
jgi:hypothetical protein